MGRNKQLHMLYAGTDAVQRSSAIQAQHLAPTAPLLASNVLTAQFLSGEGRSPKRLGARYYNLLYTTLVQVSIMTRLIQGMVTREPTSLV